MEVAILNLGCKAAVRLNTSIDKTVEKCTEFYKGMCSIHNQWQVLACTQDQDFPAREEHLKNLQETLQKGEDDISKIECVNEEAIGVWIVQVSVRKYLLGELPSQNVPKVKEIES